MMSVIAEVGINSIFPLLNLKVGKGKDKKDKGNNEEETISSDDRRKNIPYLVGKCNILIYSLIVCLYFP